jgi:hypothetical protein
VRHVVRIHTRTLVYFVGSGLNGGITRRRYLPSRPDWKLTPIRPPALDDVEDVHSAGVARVVLGVEEDQAVGTADQKRCELAFEKVAVDGLAVETEAAGRVPLPEMM